MTYLPGLPGSWLPAASTYDTVHGSTLPRDGESTRVNHRRVASWRFGHACSRAFPRVELAEPNRKIIFVLSISNVQRGRQQRKDSRPDCAGLRAYPTRRFAKNRASLWEDCRIPRPQSCPRSHQSKRKARSVPGGGLQSEEHTSEL